MKNTKIEKGRHLSTLSGSVFPSTHMNVVCVGEKEVGIGLFIDDMEIPESAIVVEDGKAIILNELDGGHPVDEASRVELARLFSILFPDAKFN